MFTVFKFVFLDMYLQFFEIKESDMAAIGKRIILAFIKESRTG